MKTIEGEFTQIRYNSCLLKIGAIDKSDLRTGRGMLNNNFIIRVRYKKLIEGGLNKNDVERTVSSGS